MEEPHGQTPRPYDQVNHFETEAHAVDAAVERRLPLRALRSRIEKATGQLRKALGPRLRVWVELEQSLNELRQSREEAYFDLGFEHGFAAGRAECMRTTPEAWHLAALLRDLAIQNGGPREKAVAALLDAAWSLAVSKQKRGVHGRPRFQKPMLPRRR